MYADYFGLKDTPFSIAPNPRYLFMSPKHREALGHLLYGVTVDGGFVMLTGEVGTGKTTICRSLLEQLPDNTDLAFVLNPLQNAKEMLQSICDELHVPFDKHDATLRSLSNALYKFLLANHARGRNTVLLIDEAQNLDTKVLELIRLLTNLETNTKKLLQIIFIGQPELREILSKPELRQLAQRITARYHIEPLTQAETADYIRHRLQVAGLPASQELFSPSLVRAIHRNSGGIPRLINILCDRLLLGAYAENKARADKATLRKALREISGEPLRQQWRQALPWALAAGLAGTLALSLWWPRSVPPPAVAASVQAPVAEPAPETRAAASPEPIAEASSGSKPVAAPAGPAAFAERAEALNALFNALGLTALTGPEPCASVTEGWRCSVEQVNNWRELLDINRPAVLSLWYPEQGLRYAVLTGVEGNRAYLLDRAGQSDDTLMALGDYWNGEVTYLWQSPVGFDKPLGQGDRGRLVAQIADQFARLDQQPIALAADQYNERLAQRVRLFQSRQGLNADGIVGHKTLQKLDEALGTAITLSGEQALYRRLETPTGELR